MSLLKKYKNIIILTLILLGILGSTGVIDFAKTIAKSVEEFFSSKPNYSNLSSQSHKFQSSFKPTQATEQTSTSKSKFYGSDTQKTAEELDQEIMNQSARPNPNRDIRFNENKLRKQFNKKDPSDENFEMDFKELDNF